MVLLVSCAHALVHVFELSLPSVEQLIGIDYEIGKQEIGWLALCWRLPWGLGSLLAGWLVDRYGSFRMLVIYLAGCAGVCIFVATQPALPLLFAGMFLMGAFASIYHPAGLGIISQSTDQRNRSRALGLHGIFGSAGIAGAPFIAWLVLTNGFSWNAYYKLLSVVGGILCAVFVLYSLRSRPVETPTAAQQSNSSVEADSQWSSYYLLTVLSMIQGFVYTAMLTFLPRYLGSSTSLSNIRTNSSLDQSGIETGVLAAGLVLLVGCVGQYLAGRFARHEKLERQQTWIMFGNVPCLLAMAAAPGNWRIVATAVFSLVHFMHQPIYNSLIAKYTPPHRRSTAYGFGLVMGFGVGSAGAVFAGYMTNDATTFCTLAVAAAVAGGIGIVLQHWQKAASTD